MGKHLAHTSQVDGTKRWYEMTPVPAIYEEGPKTGKEGWLLICNCGVLDYQDDRIYFIKNMPMTPICEFDEMMKVKEEKEKLLIEIGYDWLDDEDKEKSLAVV